MKRSLVAIILLGALTKSAWTSADEVTADQIKAIREQLEQSREQQANDKLSPEQLTARQASIDAEVTSNFKKRIQMRPSDVARIPPECDQWLLLYKETGAEKAKAGIKANCP